jgi:hypothetical protein
MVPDLLYEAAIDMIEGIVPTGAIDGISELASRANLDVLDRNSNFRGSVVSAALQRQFWSF